MVAHRSSSSSGVRCISSAKLAHFLKREQRATKAAELDLDQIFRELLRRANDFLPSEAGTIYLDDPLDVDEYGTRLSLVGIAGFGPKSDDLMEERFSSEKGIIGEVYRTGRPYSCAEPLADPVFRSGPGLRIGFTIDSVVAAPLIAEGRIIGVIELINHSSGKGYSEADLALLGTKRDELTELYNDRYLHRRLSKIIHEAVTDNTECGIIFLDLDHFKEVNDSHGHLVGSRLLSEVGATLKQIIPGNGLAARYGGDEFVIALPGAGRQETYWVAETIRQNIADKRFVVHSDPENLDDTVDFRIGGAVTCSIGIATLQSDIMPELSAENGDSKRAKDELIRKADTCMYAAKELGRNRTVPYWELAEKLASGRT
jgi:diguanylate cyclase (GGDEF)-like protein